MTEGFRKQSPGRWVLCSAILSSPSPEGLHTVFVAVTQVCGERGIRAISRKDTSLYNCHIHNPTPPKLSCKLLESCAFHQRCHVYFPPTSQRHKENTKGACKQTDYLYKQRCVSVKWTCQERYIPDMSQYKATTPSRSHK